MVEENDVDSVVSKTGLASGVCVRNLGDTSGTPHNYIVWDGVCWLCRIGLL
jgi:hypothetical protein